MKRLFFPSRSWSRPAPGRPFTKTNTQAIEFRVQFKPCEEKKLS